MDIEIICERRALESLGSAWDALVESSPNRDVVHSHPWYECWSRHFLSANDMFIVAVKDAGSLVAILPLMRKTFSKRGLRLKTIQSMTNRFSPGFDLISASASPDHLAGAMRHAFRVSRTHMILLTKVPGTSSILRGLEEACSANRCSYLVRKAEANCHVTLEGTFDDYFGGLKSKFRKNVRAAERKATQKGRLTLLSPGDDLELTQILERGFSVEAESWKGDAGLAIGRDQVSRDFFFDLGRTFFERGWLRTFLLTNGHDDLAFYYCVQGEDVIHAMVIGANPEYRSVGPGIVLTKRVLEEVFSEGRTGVWKFGGGPTRWKRDFTNDQREDYYKVFVFRDDLRGRALHALARRYDRSRDVSGTDEG